jgi:hypothetical protein
LLLLLLRWRRLLLVCGLVLLVRLHELLLVRTVDDVLDALGGAVCLTQLLGHEQALVKHVVLAQEHVDSAGDGEPVGRRGEVRRGLLLR